MWVVWFWLFGGIGWAHGNKWFTCNSWNTKAIKNLLRYVSRERLNRHFNFCIKMSTNTNAISFNSWQLHLTSSSMWYFDYGDGRRLSSMFKILWTFISNLKYKVFWLLCHSCAETVLLAKSALRSILQIRTKEITYLLLIKRRLNSSFHMMQSHLSSKST